MHTENGPPLPCALLNSHDFSVFINLHSRLFINELKCGMRFQIMQRGSTIAWVGRTTATSSSSSRSCASAPRTSRCTRCRSFSTASSSKFSLCAHSSVPVHLFLSLSHFLVFHYVLSSLTHILYSCCRVCVYRTLRTRRRRRWRAMWRRGAQQRARCSSGRRPARAGRSVRWRRALPRRSRRSRSSSAPAPPSPTARSASGTRTSSPAARRPSSCKSTSASAAAADSSASCALRFRRIGDFLLVSCILLYTDLSESI